MSIRILKPLSLLIGLLCSQAALALSVSELELHSHLGEPLLAKFSISQVGELNSEQIKIKLAPREIQQQYHVTGYKLQQRLQINWQRRGDQFDVTISTADAIKEPFQHFILQVLWPEGNLLKECTLLLNPPPQ